MKSNKIEYDAEYKIGNTKVYVVSPENPVRLGRKMTQEEIDAIIDEIIEKEPVKEIKEHLINMKKNVEKKEKQQKVY